MAVPGTKPTANPRHRNKPEHEWREVIDVPYTGAVPVRLPAKMSTFTKQWWAIVRRMPHCTLWSDSDWLFALATANVVEQHHGDPTAELRIRESKLGLTDEARRDLRIKYVAPKPVHAIVDEQATVATVTPIAGYRSDVLGD